MLTELPLDEAFYAEHLKDCILYLEIGLKVLIDKARANGWGPVEIADALAFLAIMQQWKVKEDPDATTPSQSVQ